MAQAPKRPSTAPAPENLIPAGIDEAGRGCLAGPVVAAAVILPPVFHLPGLADSKAMCARKRENLAPLIKKMALSWSLGLSWPRRIEEINILQATFEAMALAALHLKIRPDVLWIDGNKILPAEKLVAIWKKGGTGPPPDQRAFVKGDALLPAISAASILAKTFRDRLMRSLSRLWPGYGFEIHKGYAVKAHLEAIRRLGPCPMHRATFRGVRPDIFQCHLPGMRHAG